MSTNVQRITVKGLFQQDNKVLLIKDHKGVWELPGGRIEHGEQPKDALRRELQEELGWQNVKIDNLVDAWSFTSEVDTTNYHFVVLVYSCQTTEEAITKDEEYSEYQWVPIEEIDSLTMRDGYKTSIKSYHFFNVSATL